MTRRPNSPPNLDLDPDPNLDNSLHGSNIMQINCSNIRDLPRPKYLDNIREYSIKQNGHSTTIKSFELASNFDNITVSEWALHIRRHYMRDDELANSTRTLPTEEYLSTMVIPDCQNTRTGDFGETIVSDIIEHLEGYIVPRYKQFQRIDKNLSGPGIDIVAYIINSPTTPSRNDKLLLIEVKSSRRQNDVSGPLRKAKSEYRKNLTRRAMTVDSIRRKASMCGDEVTANEIERFQDANTVDFQEMNGYAIVISIKDIQSHMSRFNTKIIETDDQHVYVVHRDQLGELIDDIYGKCTQ